MGLRWQSLTFLLVGVTFAMVAAAQVDVNTEKEGPEPTFYNCDALISAIEGSSFADEAKQSMLEYVHEMASQPLTKSQEKNQDEHLCATFEGKNRTAKSFLLSTWASSFLSLKKSEEGSEKEIESEKEMSSVEKCLQEAKHSQVEVSEEEKSDTARDAAKCMEEALL